MASIKYQIINAVDSGFKEGAHDKHSAKRNESTAVTVYSFKERENLKDTGIQLVKYCKSNFDVKQVSQITSKMVSSFLENKATTCTQTTISQYSSRIEKLANLVNSRFKTASVNWKVDSIVALKQEKTRDVKMERCDFEAVIKHAADSCSKSQAPIALQLAEKFGMRVSETCKLQPRDMDFDKMKLHIHESKGGLSRNVDIKARDVDFLKEIIEGKSSDEKIVSIKEDSVNKFLSRTFEKIGITKYNSAKTGVHSIRKMAATLRYFENIEKGMGEKDAEKEVSRWLGHGEDRTDVISNYIYK